MFACAVAAKSNGIGGLRPVLANGLPALAIPEGGSDDMVMTLAPSGEGRIGWIYVMRIPDKLARLS